MNVTNFTTKSVRGVFTIEVAIIALFMSAVLVFTSDVVVKQSVEGMLDRMSYSAVSVIKERTQLYENAIMTDEQINQVNTIVRRSLQRTMSQFDSSRYRAFYQQFHFTHAGEQGSLTQRVRGEATGANCQPLVPLSFAQARKLSPLTNEGRRADVFQVTLCYRTENWYGQLVNKNFEWVSSTSVLIGR